MAAIIGSFLLGVATAGLAIYLLRGKIKDSYYYCGQQLLMMYIIKDELFRAKLINWCKSMQADKFATAVERNITGKIYLLPLERPETIGKIISDLEPRRK